MCSSHWVPGGIAFVVLSTAAPALAQGTARDYERAAGLAARSRNKVFKVRVTPHWLSDNQRFWYRNDLAGGAREFILVDAARGERKPAFDHQRLAAVLGKLLGKDVPANRLPIEEIAFDDAGVRFNAGGKHWACSLSNYQVRPTGKEKAGDAALLAGNVPRPSDRTGEETWITFINRSRTTLEILWIDSEGVRRSYARLAAGQQHRQHTYAGHMWLVADRRSRLVAVFEAMAGDGRAIIDEAAVRKARATRLPPRRASVQSPDGKWDAVVKDHNVYLRDRKTAAEIALSREGADDDAYAGPFYWSPDSGRLVVLRTRKGDDRKIHFIESSPRDQLQPRLHSLSYLKPGDRIPISKPHLFDVAARKEIPVSNALFPNPWSIDEVRWAGNSRCFTFLYNQRGHQVLRLVAVDARTGQVRSVIDEQSKTFIDYAHKRFIHYLDGTGEIVWMSERDGWNHLYLYDAGTGKVKGQITRGPWVVRGIDRVDDEKRQVWFRASGIHAGQDPYYIHYCRINLDGTGLVVLTEGDGTHSIEYSPDRRFLVDSYSRVDMPPVTEVRRVEDGKRMCELERADMSALLATGWKVPERFTAKGRDGRTDIYGVIYRPTTLDPRKKYPVIEHIYAGPQGSFVPKRFRAFLPLQALGELGFIVVQIDGMGTSNRSKAFHDVCWKNLGDAGFPDRILWIKAAAAKHPYIDAGRVGIHGGSAGGQSATRAVLAHPNFYKAAVSGCGCHDNRMDKIWWNELWMGWPVGPHYREQSNVTNAHKLRGKLLLIVGELDRNVDPASTMQVVDALIRAGKDFDLVVVPGAGHGMGGAYGARRLQDFFVRHLLGVTPPDRNSEARAQITPAR
jgi:dipeptidyl aminopeptidase/acylaminoacyl peptidase